MDQIVIFEKNNPVLHGVSTEQIMLYSQQPDTDMNPITPDTLAAQYFGYCAVSAHMVSNMEYELLEVVGYAGHTKDREYNGSTYTQIGNLVVLPEWQGNSLAKKLIVKNRDLAISRGCQNLAAVCNHLSSGVFKACGFGYVADVISDSGKQKPLYVYHHGEDGPNRVE